MFFRSFLLLLSCLAPLFASAAHATMQQPIKIVVLGDDLIGGEGLFSKEDGFDVQLKGKLEHDVLNERVDVVMFAETGTTLLSAIPLIPNVMAATPDIVIVAVGYNDALAGTEPDIVYNNLDILLRELDRVGAFVLLVGVEAPSTLPHEYAARFNSIYPTLAQRHRVGYHNGFLRDIEGDVRLTQSDLYHPNKFGVMKITESMFPAIKNMTLQIRRRRWSDYMQQLNQKRLAK
jgi:acyl-CoA thioesterase-1